MVAERELVWANCFAASTTTNRTASLCDLCNRAARLAIARRSPGSHRKVNLSYRAIKHNSQDIYYLGSHDKFLTLSM
jgi:hypothetical protein